MSEFAKQLVKEFDDKEYAHAYMESHTVSRIAAQIFALRRQRRWSQQELAQRAGVSQERISKIESGDFNSLTLKTLWKFSEAFDVHLHVAFKAFRQGIMDVTNLLPERLEVDSRLEDLAHVSNHTRMIEREGEWRVIVPNVNVVRTQPVSNSPVIGVETKQNLLQPKINNDWHSLAYK